MTCESGSSGNRFLSQRATTGKKVIPWFAVAAGKTIPMYDLQQAKK